MKSLQILKTNIVKAALASAFLFVFHSANALITPNDFEGDDSSRIEAAIKKACETGERSVEIPRMNKVRKDAVWLIDRAILLPDDFTLVLRDCLVRLAPDVKDNIIRNAGAQNGKLAPNKNISIVGVGNPVLSGGLKCHYGARSGDKNGWRTIGILLVSVKGFKIENLTLQNTQAWGISVESGSSDGRISNITFDDKNDMRNQDGVDIRKGCHDIVIENIFGRVGDDAVALTGYRTPPVPEDKRVFGGDGMQYGGRWETGADDIYNITIKNVQAKCLGGHGIVRLLNQDGVNMYNIIVRDIVDTATGNEPRAQATIRIGDIRFYKQRRSQMGEMRNILVDGVMAKGKVAVWIKGPLCDSAIRNVFTETSQTKRYDTSVPTERVILE